MELGVVVALILAALVGLSLGLLGGGGSILAVPILTYIVGMPPQEAIAASLFIVGVTSAVGMLSHAKSRRVRWKTGILFGVAGMVGAFAGAMIGGYVPGTILMILFAIMMVTAATAMIRGRKDRDAAVEERPNRIFTVLLTGFAVGIATGLVGVGGGFLIVPALTLLGGLPMAVAVGTSLLVIMLNSLAGFAGAILNVQLDWPLVLAFTAIAVAGSFVGSALIGKIPQAALRKGFGIFVLIMGAIVLAQEIPRTILLLSSGSL